VNCGGASTLCLIHANITTDATRGYFLSIGKVGASAIDGIAMPQRSHYPRAVGDIGYNGFKSKGKIAGNLFQKTDQNVEM